MNISSYMPVDVFYGKNALLENGKEIKKLGSRLIVTSPTAAKKSESP